MRGRLKMAITVTKDYPHSKKIGKGVWLLCGTIAFDSSYPTGGEAATNISKYFKDIKRIIFDGQDGYTFEYSNSGDLILVHMGGFEVANATDLSSLDTVSFIAIGYN
jgi:hypothetical protein